ARHNGLTVYFCSDRCRDKFIADPGRYADGATAEPQPAPQAGRAPIDPVCGMTVEPGSDVTYGYAGRVYYFCSRGCRDEFAAHPQAYVAAAPDPVGGMDSP